MMRSVIAAALATTVCGLPRGGMRAALRDAANRPPPTTGSDDLFFTQRLDHFDASLKNETFQQRYFVNTTFYEPGGPVFLCCGGEGPALDETVLYHSVHCNDMTELAPEAGALLLALEHRYYGASIPPSTERGAARLRHLTSHQAVGDVATFHAHVSDAFNLSAATKWVTFGGSYPGMVSGFARLRLPHLIHASVSSSAPWHAKADMAEYNDVVADALANEAVGGSDACRDVVATGHASIKEQLETSTAARAAVAATFDFCDDNALEDESVRRSWAGYGVVDVPAQENDPADGTVNGSIGVICDALLGADGDAVDALARVSSLQHGGQCVRSADLLAPAVADDDATDALSWPWQTCAEFGYYQTCEVGTRCPFAQGYVTLADEISMCAEAFGLGADVVEDNVAFSNLAYGGDAPRGARILFPNGDVDPWSGLGVVDSPAPGEPTMMVRGASHHAWTHPADEISQPTVAAAKKHIQEQVMAWLAED